MEVTINGNAHQVPAEMSLERAVRLVSSLATGVAAAVNGQVVHKAVWHSTQLAAGDQIEVLTAVQGG